MSDFVTYIEPNYVSDGKTLHDLEDYSVMVQLETTIPGKQNIGGVEVDGKSFVLTWGNGDKKVNFMQGKSMIDGNYYTTSYTEATYADILNGGTNEMFGISSIDIQYNEYRTPMVTIDFVDIRGISLFGVAESEYNGDNVASSFFKSFFMFPYPLFTLTVKGFYGEPLSYELTVVDFRARFDSNTGNFNATAKFIGRQFALLNDITLNALIAAPLCAEGSSYWNNRVNEGVFVTDDGNNTPLPKLDEFISKYKSINQSFDTVSNSNIGRKKKSIEFDIIDLKKDRNNIEELITLLKNNNFIIDTTNQYHLVLYIKKPQNETDIHIQNYFTFLSDKKNRLQVLEKWEIIKRKNLLKENIKYNVKTYNSLNDTDYLYIDREVADAILGTTEICEVSFDFMKVINLIDSEISAKQTDMADLVNEIETLKKNEIGKLLQIEPNIYNITKIIMAHMETLIYLIRSCAENVGNKRPYNTFFKNGVELQSIDDIKRLHVGPFFDCTVKRPNNQGGYEYVDTWIGDVIKDFGLAHEMHLINSLLSGIEKYNHKLEYINSKNNQKNKIGSYDILTPIIPIDFYSIERKYSIWSKDNIIDFTNIAKLIVKRGLCVCSMTDSKYDSEYGKIDANNFLNQFSSQYDNIVNMVGTSTLVSDAILNSVSFDGQVNKDLFNKGVQCANISIDDSNKQDTPIIFGYNTLDNELSENAKETDVYINDDKVFGNQYVLINKDYQAYTNLEIIGGRFNELTYNNESYINEYINNDYEVFTPKDSDDVSNKFMCFSNYKNFEKHYSTESINNLLKKDNSDYELTKYIIPFFSGYERDDNEYKITNYYSLFSQDWFYDLNRNKTKDGYYTQSLVFLFTLKDWYDHKCFSSLNIKNGNNGMILPYLALVTLGGKFWCESKYGVPISISNYTIGTYRESVKKVLIKLFLDWSDNNFNKILNNFSITLKDGLNFTTLKNVLNNKLNQTDVTIKDVLDANISNIGNFYRVYNGIIVNEKQLVFIHRQNSNELSEIMLDLTSKCAVIKSDFISGFVNNGRLKNYMNGFIDEIKNQYKSNTKNSPIVNEVETTKHIKCALYKYIKLLYDKWVGCELYNDDKTHWNVDVYFKNHFHFIDSFYNKKYDVWVDLEDVYNRIVQSQSSEGYSLLSFLSGIYQHNKFIMYSVQNFLDYSGSKDNPIKNMFTPIAYNNLKSIRRTNTHSDIVIMQGSEPSKHLNMADQNGINNDDSFMLNDTEKLPLPISMKAYSNTVYNDLKIPCFGVSYGSQYQSFFQNIDISMDNPVVTEHSIKAYMQAVGVFKSGEATQDNGSESKIITTGQHLYPIYANNSYTCTLTMMGCAWVQPLMYFCLLNVPMFRGSYLVQKVSHKITPGSMKTIIVGTRMAKKSQTTVSDYAIEKESEFQMLRRTNSIESYLDDNDNITQCAYNTYIENVDSTNNNDNLSKKNKFISIVKQTLNNCNYGSNHEIYDLLSSDSLVMNLSITNKVQESEGNAKLFDIILTSYADKCAWINWVVMDKNSNKSFPIFVQVKLRDNETTKSIGVAYVDKDNVAKYYNDNNKNLFNDIFYKSISKYESKYRTDLKNYTTNIELDGTCKLNEKKSRLQIRKAKVDEFIIHCTATKENYDYTVDDIRSWHVSPNRNWADIAYHYIIDKDGVIYQGRDEIFIGDHCKGHNYKSIGICYIGGYDRNGNVTDTRTQAQKDSMRQLLLDLHKKYPEAKVYGHRDFANKACPCFDATSEYKNIFT